MNRRVKGTLRLGLVAGGLLAAAAVGAEDLPVPSTGTATVEERLSALERKVASGDGATVTASTKDGFQIRSGDGHFSLRLSGYLQDDYRAADTFADQFLIRRARVIVSGAAAPSLDFRIAVDVANGGTTSGPTSTLLPDAYAEYHPRSWARLRAGKFKSPVGLELLQSDRVTLFNERGLPSQLVPNRDTGVQIGGDVDDGALSYQIAVLNGVPDGASGEADTSDAKDYVARLVVQPFKRGPAVGVAGSTGRTSGTAATSNLTSGVRSDGQQPFFTYASGTFADGARRRLSPQGTWTIGPFRFLGEYVASSQDVRRVDVSTRTATITNRAWQIAAACLLTGERASFGGIQPRGAWGAVEAAARYQIFRADDDAFGDDGFFASPAASAKRARAWTAGLNWYVNDSLKLASDYDVTSFVGGAPDGRNRPTERALLSRIQLSF